MNNASKENIWNEINNALQERFRKPTDDERTIRQLSAEWGTKHDYTYSMVRKLVEAGVLLIRQDAHRTIYARPNYKVENVTEIIQEIVLSLK